MNSGQAMQLWKLVYFLEEQGFTNIGVTCNDSKLPSARIHIELKLQLHLDEENVPRKAKPQKEGNKDGS